MKKLLKSSKKWALMGLLTFSATSSYGVESSLVFPGSNGKLQYATYANRGQSNSVNKIPDFSYAGYQGGGVALPTVPVRVTVNPVSGDNYNNIQNAINQVQNRTPDSNGFRGAVLLKAGTYNVSQTLLVTKSGVVLRGEGNQDSGGTKLILTSTATNKPNLLDFEGIEEGSGGPTETNETDITTSYVATGSRSFNVASTAGYSVGDLIVVVRTPNNKWITDTFTSSYGWVASDYVVKYERRITAISGNTITIDAPMVQVIENQYGGGYVAKFSWSGRISKVGVENMRLQSVFASSTDENHGWDAVRFKSVVNGWVRDVTARYFAFSCVKLAAGSKFVTVQDCAMLDHKSQITGGRRYSFVIQSSRLGGFNLFQRCYAREGRHSFVVQARCPGPNVFVDCASDNSRSLSGPHQRYSTGTLFDNLLDGGAEVKNRANLGTGHGWAGAQTLFWNSVMDKSRRSSGTASEFHVNSPPTARNWGIGCKVLNGTPFAGGGFWESQGTHVDTRSLYYKQLEDRLGIGAVNNVTYAEQLTGTIWNDLDSWAGDGNFRLTGNPGGGGSFPNIESVSEQASGTPASNLLDGDTNGDSRWSANGFPQNVVIDYGESKTISGTRLWTYQNRAYRYTVAVSNNPTSGFTTVVDRSNNTSNSQPITNNFSAVTGRYVRITVTGASGYSGPWVSLREFEIVEGAGGGGFPNIESVSNEQSGNPASNLLDGNTNDSSRWSADGFPQSVIIDNGPSPAAYNKIKVWTYQNRAYQYKVWGSDDLAAVQNEQPSKLRVDRSNNTSSGQPITDTTSGYPWRYLKIKFTGASGYSGSWVSITEIDATN